MTTRVDYNGEPYTLVAIGSHGMATIRTKDGKQRLAPVKSLTFHEPGHNLEPFDKGDEMKTTLFTVQGSGSFPFDMLRYDRCWPATQEDVAEMMASSHDHTARGAHYGARSVVMASHINQPTVDRWRSFGWNVVNKRKV